jgi:ABC-2 type transport system ATP-binding protein
VRDFLREYNSKEKTTILLTSHYMTDIQELCRRVVIIDHGKIFFDGGLSEIIDRFADVKIVTISWQIGAKPPADMKKYGEVMSEDSHRIELKVKRDQVVAVCKKLLDELPVSDIDIQDLPIEDVIRQIFAR